MFVLRVMYQLLNYGNIVDVFLVSIEVWAQAAILLMYGSHDMRHIGFPWVNGLSTDPRGSGRHILATNDRCEFFWQPGHNSLFTTLSISKNLCAFGLGGSSDISLGLESGPVASITILWYAFSAYSDAG